MLAVTTCSVPSRTNGASSACWTRSATRTAPSSEARSSQSTTNSSPPKRASVNSASPKRATRVARSQGRLQPVRDGLQELVAGVVAEGVVDVLEPVEIQEQQRRERPVALGARQRKLETVAEEEPVRQPGERVVRRLVSDLLLRVDSLDHASKMPADLSHHLEQGGVGRDGRRGEELENRLDLAIRVDREREGSPNSKVLPGKFGSIVTSVIQAALPVASTRPGKPDPLGKCRLLGRAGERPRTDSAGRCASSRSARGPRRRGRAHTHVPPARSCVRRRHRQRPEARPPRSSSRWTRDHRLEQHELLLLVVQRSGRPLRDLVYLTAREPFASQPLLEHPEPGLR